MSLRIRRGTEAQREGVVFDSGELVVTTDEFRLYVGDGITQGGRSIASNLGGSGVVFNEDTGRLDLSLNITADDVPNGVNNQYFSTELAQDAAASLLTTGVHSGITFSYTSTQDSANRLDATVSLNLDALTDVVISETPTNGQVLKYNSAAGKWIPGNDSGIGGGLTSVQDDTTPTLGGNLDLNNHDITGTGDVNITGAITATTITGGISGSLSDNLLLNSYSISGTGSISVAGEITATTFNGKLGANLPLNAHNITGVGNISIDGNISNSKVVLTNNSILSTDNTTPVNTSNGADNDYVLRIGNTTTPVTMWISSVRNFGVMTGLIGGDAADGTALYYRTSRGSISAPTILEPGDRIAKNVAQGWDGEKYWHAGGYGIGTDPAETIDVGMVPGRFEATVRGPDGAHSMFYTSRGILTGAVLQPTSFATPTDRDVALPSGVRAAGMMCFVADSTGLGGPPKFQGYNGTDWVDLG